MEELAPASLGDGASEEKLQAVFGEQGLFILREGEKVVVVEVEEEEEKEKEEGGRRERRRRKRRGRKLRWV